MRATTGPDKLFFASAGVLTLAGLFVFISASFGLLIREGSATFFSVAFNQFVFGLAGGALAGFVIYKLKINSFYKFSPYIFVLALILTALTLLPQIGLESGGARRWLDLGFASFQPSEFLKLAFIIFSAALLSRQKDLRGGWRGILILAVLSGPIIAILLAQPNTGSAVVIVITGIALLIASGAKWSQAGLAVFVVIIGLLLLSVWRPYLTSRIISFINPSLDPLGSSYQSRQALVTVGSGGLTGRGFGQSIQKFNYLPEPVGDSIFAILAEEFGFIGSSLVILMFVIFGWRGLTIARRAPDNFTRLVVCGIVIMIITQSFFNISSMIGVLPIAGLPLLFISHGGTALFFTLVEVGLVLNISRYQSV